MFSSTLPNHKYVSLILFSLLGFALSLTLPNVFQSQGAEDSTCGKRMALYSGKEHDLSIIPVGLSLSVVSC